MLFGRSVGILMWLLCYGVGCSALSQTSATPLSLSFDFRNGALGWEVGFADYPPSTDIDNFYQLEGGLRPLPAEVEQGRTGFYVQGNNHSDSLFMFLKRRLSAGDGIVAGQTYQLTFNILFASNAPTGCAGIGGSPGDGVFLKAGASGAEPISLLGTRLPHPWLTMNVDVGTTGRDGFAASIAGTIANTQSCGTGSHPYESVSRSHTHTALVNANSRGELWLIVGTHSGFEGLTGLYYQRVDVSMVPSAAPSPGLLTEEITGRAVALESVTLKSEPFDVIPEHSFSPDQLTRVTVCGYNLELRSGGSISAITAEAEDSQQRIYSLPVEAVKEIPRFGWIHQVTVKLPRELQGSGDVWVTLLLRGVRSNKVRLRIK